MRALVVALGLIVLGSIAAWLVLAIDDARAPFPNRRFVSRKLQLDSTDPRYTDWSTVADRDGDGLRDLWIVGGPLGGHVGAVFSGRTGREILRIDPLPSFRDPFDPGDANRDGMPDLGLVAWGADGAERLWIASGLDGSTLVDAPFPKLGLVPCAVGDVDGDGTSDVVTASSQGEVTVLCLSGRDGTQLWTVATGAEFVWSVLALEDVDRDGTHDVAVSIHDDKEGSVRALSGHDGSAIWEIERSEMTFGHLLQTCTDRDGDGLDEVWAWSWPRAEVMSGATGASLGRAKLSGSGPFADLDGDGIEEEVRTGIVERGSSPFSSSRVFVVEIATPAGRRRAEVGALGGFCLLDDPMYPPRTFCEDLDGDAFPDYVAAGGGAVHVLSGARFLRP